MIQAGPVRGTAGAEGRRVVYESTGAGKPAVLLVHGGFEDRSYYAAQVGHLAGRHQVVTLDLAGFGESQVPEQVTMEGFEEDVIAVLDRVAAGPAVLVGHSMAGAVALSVAARRPDLVAGVVMLDAVIFFPEPVRQKSLTELLPALRSDHWLDALRGFFGATLDPLDPPELRARVMADLGRTRQEIAVSFFTSLFGGDYEGRQARLAQIVTGLRCPLMYVHAKTPSGWLRLAELSPEVMLGKVVGSGHYLMISAADQLNAMLDRFLEAVAQRP